MKRLIQMVAVSLLLISSACQRHDVAVDCHTGRVDTIYAESDSIDPWMAFAFALAKTESNWNQTAVNDDCVGFLQIRPIMVAEANRIVGFECFHDYDRLDYQGAFAIFNVVQNYYNPNHDFKKAFDIWNIRHPQSYEEKTMQTYAAIMSGELEIPFSY